MPVVAPLRSSLLINGIDGLSTGRRYLRGPTGPLPSEPSKVDYIQLGCDASTCKIRGHVAGSSLNPRSCCFRSLKDRFFDICDGEEAIIDVVRIDVPSCENNLAISVV